jgi:hypothetical protein
MSVTVVSRRVAATPARSAAAAWTLIVDLIAPKGTAARAELDGLAGIGMAIVASEAMRESPLVVRGSGPLLRIYCVYDERAILGEGLSEDPLPWCPIDGDWAMSLPCPAEDLSWVQPALTRISTRVTARNLAEQAPASEVAQQGQEAVNLGDIDTEAFLRP